MTDRQNHAFVPSGLPGNDDCAVCGYGALWIAHSSHVENVTTWQTVDEDGKLSEEPADLRESARAYLGLASSADESKFVKHDSEKPRMDLIPPKALLSIAKVLTFGAKKYAPNNWKQVNDLNRYVAASLRHIVLYMTGEKTDPDSGEPHLSHACCCLMFILELDEQKTEK